MRTITGDIWHVFGDAIVIPVNGYVKTDGRAVMGRGLAKQAADKWKHLPLLLGNAITAGRVTGHGNHVRDLWKPSYGPTIVTFPVKRSWRDQADPGLIMQSVEELVGLTDRLGWKDVALPRVGCGNGGLEWSLVEKLLEPLDDRFVLVTLHEGPHSWGCDECKEGYLAVEGIGGTMCACECHVDVPEGRQR